VKGGSGIVAYWKIVKVPFRMKNKIIFFWSILFLGIFLSPETLLAQSTSATPKIYAYTYEKLSLNCAEDQNLGCRACSVSMSIYLNVNESVPSNYFQCGGPATPSGTYVICIGGALGQGQTDPGCAISGGPNYCYSLWRNVNGPYGLSSQNNFYYGCNPLPAVQAYEQSVDNLLIWGCLGYSINPAVDPCVDVPQIINPASAPIGSPLNSPAIYGNYSSAILVPVNLMTLTKDPVNIATGEAYFFSIDFSLKAQGPALALSRKFNSFSTFNGIFGYGWRTDYDLNLSVDSSGDVTIFDANAVGSYFMNNSGIFSASPGNYSTIVKNADNTYTITGKNGNVTHYDINGRFSSLTDRNGNILTFVYNPEVVGGSYIQDAVGRKIKLYFDANGHVISAVDPVGKAFQYSYDANGNLVSVIDPTGSVVNYTYNANHQIIQFTNPNSHNTYYQYDTQGRVIMNWQDKNINEVDLNYQSNNTTVVTDSLGNNNTYVFNNYGLLLSHTDPLGAVTKENWDPMMNMISKTDALNHTTNFVYDAQGNLIQIVDPLSNLTSFTYTPNFNLISSKTDAMNQTTNYVYDIKGDLTAIIDPLGNTRHFTYDQYGNIIKVTDTLTHDTNFTYDNNGNVLQITDALQNKTNFTYDADGNILTKTDARNLTTGYQYDNLNRLVKITFDGSP